MQSLRAEARTRAGRGEGSRLIHLDLPALALLIVANSAPVLVAAVLGRRYDAPIDAHIRLRDGTPLFGSHKTWRGLAAGVLAAALCGAWLSHGFVVGATFASLSLIGDLCSSFIKRRLHRASGSWTPLLDQLPEAMLPMIVLKESLNLTVASIVGTTLLFTAIDLIAAKWRAT